MTLRHRMRAETALQELIEEDVEGPLASALKAYIADPSSLDNRINLIGAQHQAGWLRNRIAPYLKDFAAHDSPWLGRCLNRMFRSQGDDWAVRALLYSDGRNLLPLVLH